MAQTHKGRGCSLAPTGRMELGVWEFGTSLIAKFPDSDEMALQTAFGSRVGG